MVCLIYIIQKVNVHDMWTLTLFRKMSLKNKILLLIIFGIVFIFHACVPAVKKTEANTKPKEIDNTLSSTRKLKSSETFTVELMGRRASGLQLLYRMNNNAVVEVKRLVTDIANSGPTSGDTININYQIKAIKKGKVKITFYETQPWNKDFKEVIQKEINIEVTE